MIPGAAVQTTATGRASAETWKTIHPEASANGASVIGWNSGSVPTTTRGQ